MAVLELEGEDCQHLSYVLIDALVELEGTTDGTRKARRDTARWIASQLARPSEERVAILELDAEDVQHLHSLLISGVDALEGSDQKIQQARCETVRGIAAALSSYK